MYKLPILEKAFRLAHGFSTKEEGNQEFGTQPKHRLIPNQANFLRQVYPEYDGYPLGMAVRMLPLVRGYEEEITVVSSADAGRGMAAPNAIPCEGMITNSPELFLYIAVGDCIPIVMYDPRRRVIALVHGGREPTIRRLPEKTLAMMQKEFGTNLSDVIVGMGPGFRSHYVERLPDGVGGEWSGYIRPNGHRKLHMDLFGYTEDRLMAAGVPEENIEECPHDTYKDADLFFSHRRSQETGNPEDDGRHACAVGMV